MNLLLALCLVGSIGHSLALRITITECLKVVFSWDPIDCTPYEEALEPDFIKIWDDRHLEVFADWLDNELDPNWSQEEIRDYCLWRECHTNQAMVDYIGIHGNAPYCAVQNAEDWINDRYWVRCAVKADPDYELTPEGYATYFCYKTFHAQDPAVDCPEERFDYTVQSLEFEKESRGAKSIEEVSEFWWNGWLQNAVDASRSTELRNYNQRTIKWAWIMSKDMSQGLYGVMTPLWCPYHGAVIPIERDMNRIIPAVAEGKGMITFGDVRFFDCTRDPFEPRAMVCPEIGREDNPSVGTLLNELETLVTVETEDHILMALVHEQENAPMAIAGLNSQALKMIEYGM